MSIKKLLKKIKCKMFVCCGSKCSLNDTDGDGIIDTLNYRDEKGNKVIISNNNNLVRSSTYSSLTGSKTISG